MCRNSRGLLEQTHNKNSYLGKHLWLLCYRQYNDITTSILFSVVTALLMKLNNSTPMQQNSCPLHFTWDVDPCVQFEPVTVLLLMLLHIYLCCHTMAHTEKVWKKYKYFIKKSISCYVSLHYTPTYHTVHLSIKSKTLEGKKIKEVYLKRIAKFKNSKQTEWSQGLKAFQKKKEGRNSSARDIQRALGWKSSKMATQKKREGSSEEEKIHWHQQRLAEQRDCNEKLREKNKV